MAWSPNISDDTKPFSMADASHDTYSNLIDYFEATYPDYKKYRSPTAEKPEEIAGEIAQFMPAHYYKLIATFLKEKNRLNGMYNSSKLVVLDIGSGVGTSKYAIMDMVIKLGTSLKEIHFIHVEPCAERTRLRDQVANFYEMKLSSTVKITKENIVQKFPNCAEEIINCLKKYPNYYLIVIAGNLLHWIDYLTPLQSPTAKGLNKVLFSCPQYRIDILNIETDGFALLTLMNKYYKYLDNRIQRIVSPVKDGPYACVNPSKHPYPSWRNKEWTKPLYFYKSFAQLKTYCEKIGNKRYIENSYYSARVPYKAEVFHDALEVKVFSSVFEESVLELETQIKQGFEYLRDILQYKIPKQNGKSRPLVVESFYNEVVSGTFLKYWASLIDEEFDRNVPVCFGDRLEKDTEVPKIYKDYYNQYFAKYLAKAKELCMTYSHYAKIDVVSFFKNISQANLEDNLKERINGDVNFEKSIHSLITRVIIECNMGNGIPQGAIASGFLANVYLQPLDIFLQNLTEIGYIRYVDDIFIFANTENDLDNVLKQTESFLKSKLVLSIHHSGESNKDIKGKSTELLTSLDTKNIELDGLGKDINSIVHSLYYINNSSGGIRYVLWKEDSCDMYSRCLGSLGIHISGEWLKYKCRLNAIGTAMRKIKDIRKTLTWLNRKGFHVVKWTRLPKNTEGIVSWNHKFTSSNPKLNELVLDCSSRLYTLLERYANLYKIASDNVITVRTLKFCFKKLSVITNPNAGKIIADFLDMPWILPHRTLVPYPELYPQIKKEFSANMSDYKFLRAVWLFGEWQVEKKSILTDLVQAYKKTLSEDVGDYSLANTLITEAMLKKEELTTKGSELINDTISYIEEQVKRVRGGHAFDYHKIRNAYILLNYLEPKSLSFHDEFRKDFRMNLLYKSLFKNAGRNLLSIEEPFINDDTLYPVLEPFRIGGSS